MLKADDVVAEMAGVVKASPVTVAHYVRNLKEAGLGQWPTPGRGRRKLEIEVRHLVNLLLAALGGDPIEAATTVERYRPMHISGIRLHEGADYLAKGAEAPASIAGVPLAATLGETLEMIVSACIKEGRHGAHHLLFAELYLSEQNLGAAVEIRAPGIGRLRIGFSGPTKRSTGELTTLRIVQIWPPTFHKIAAIWKATVPEFDTLKRENAAPARAAPTRNNQPREPRAARHNTTRDHSVVCVNVQDTLVHEASTLPNRRDLARAKNESSAASPAAN